MDVKRRTIKSLVSKLSSVSEQTRSEAMSELRLISKHDPESRPIISDEGAIPFLSETLFSPSHSAQSDAAATLLNLSISTSSRQSLISTRGLLDSLSHSLRHHRSSSSPAAVQSSAALLHSLLSSDDQFRPIVGSKRDIIYSLIDIIKTPNSPPRSVKDSLKALFGISLYPLNRASMVELGAVAALFSLVVKDGRVGIVEDSTAVIAQVAGCEESLEAFRRVSGIGVLADLLDPVTGSSVRTKENAVSALLNLGRCCGEVAVREVAAAVGAVGAAEGLADVAEAGSQKGRTKAVGLIRIIVGVGRDYAFRDSRFDSLLSQFHET